MRIMVACMMNHQVQESQKIHFVSLGCSKNRVDTEVMIGIAQNAGLELVPNAENADVVVINTCGFIGEAKAESIDTILEMSSLRTQGHVRKLVVTGCLSQRYADELAREMPEVDHFLGSSDMLKLDQVLKGQADRILVGNPAQWVLRKEDPRAISTGSHSAYVKIAEGCNRSCSFCAIPQMRGKQRSRSIEDIVGEVELLVQQGVVEINLISQDTVAYGRDFSKDVATDDTIVGKPLAQVVERIANVSGVQWVRLFYLYPETLDEHLVDLLAHHPHVVPYVDMPLQHASNAMLKRMRRGHGIDRQKRVVERLRNSIHGLTFRTAFIVGHPGETEDDFEELIQFIQWAEFEHVAAFRYSDEETTHAFTLDQKVPAKVANERYRRLMATQNSISKRKNQAFIGQELEVLVEGTSDEHEWVRVARHRGQAPEIDGNVYLEGPEVETVCAGEIRRVIVTQNSDYDLAGELLPRTISEHTIHQSRQRLFEKLHASSQTKRIQLPVLSSLAGR